MFSKVFFFTLISFATNVFSQNINLLCKGDYSDYTQGIRDVQVSGVIVKIANKKAVVINSITFDNKRDDEYLVTKISDEQIKFISVFDANVVGSLNRYSGDLSLSHVSDDRVLFRLLKANCFDAKRKF